jgi:hypothetical protein
VISLAVIDISMIETATTKMACVPYYPVVVKTCETAARNILPTRGERPRQRITSDVKRRVAYLLAMIRHASPVFSICVF